MKQPEDDRTAAMLAAADAAAMDALLNPQDGDQPVDEARRGRVAGWLAVLGASATPEPPGTLMARTLARISQEAAVEGAADEQKQTGESRWRDLFRSRRMAEISAIAAAVAVLITVLIPMLVHARAQAQQTACAGNLSQFALAIGNYAQDQGGRLPELAAAGTSWLPRGDVTAAGTPVNPDSPVTEHSNNANLIPLVRDKYARPEILPCPAAEVSTASFNAQRAVDIPEGIRGYSYVNLFGSFKPVWNDGPAVAVLADRSPLFGPAGVDDMHANSPNHGGRGNNVLMADGHAQWMTSPDVAMGGKIDNLWTPAGAGRGRLMGTETASYAGDFFVAP